NGRSESRSPGARGPARPGPGGCRREGRALPPCGPLCEQPIAQDLARRIELRQQEQQRASLAQARAEAEAKVEQQIAAAVAEANKAAEAAMLSKLANFQEKLVVAEQAQLSAQKEIAALKAAQDTAIELCVVERTATLKEERDAAILAERTRSFEETQALRQKLEDLTRKLEGKSAHELGEGSEIDLFDELRDAFQDDRIQRVPKGVNGADVIHEVVHNGRVCGKIIYDAKNRDSWQNGFATKLRADKLAQAADHAILSSNKFPKDKSQIHTQDGVIVANPARVLVIAEILREQIVRMHELRASKEAREEKTVALYAFVTSDHFKQLVEQVEAQAGKMLELDGKEQEAHRRIWDQRGKLIRTIQKARADLTFEVDRIIGTAGNGPQA
ncbi:MAG TPA: DUF2130 domain-containing protein, partial [Hyphomicrobiaceae bacterium]|nr:DUF2130 domain-containing protein [Hyphomicrobiaceae bacterium]